MNITPVSLLITSKSFVQFQLEMANIFKENKSLWVLRKCTAEKTDPLANA